MMSSIDSVKTVAIIGAGATGLAATKYLVAEKTFSKISVFEQSSRVGGIWNLTPAFEKGIDVPQINPNQPLDKPAWVESRRNGFLLHSRQPEAMFMTPLYDRLETNIPKGLMRFSDKPFPSESQLFPKHETVQQYLEEYANEIRGLISLETQVVDVHFLGTTGQWSLTLKDVRAGSTFTLLYDAVVVANGHFSVPIIPAITGISDWNTSYPEIITHSKWYRLPEKYQGKKVIVVGNSASGLDIGSQIGAVCKQPLLASQRSDSYLSPSPSPWKEDLPPIAQFISSKSHDRAVKFANGRIEERIDAIVFATGYFYSFPFLSSLEPPLVDDGARTRHMYKHFLHIDHPTLAIPVLNQKIIPFPLAEAQAAVIARLWSGRLTLPTTRDMKAWEASVVTERGPGREFHMLGFPADVENLNWLHDWAAEACRRDGLEHDGVGKQGPRWGERERWQRERFPAIKKAFAERGDDRHSIRTLEELGYDFEAWKREQEEQDPSKTLL